MSLAALIAGVAFVTCPALADEPFPNWDINQSALRDSMNRIECAKNINHPSDEDKIIASVDPQVVFNQYVIWETTTRNYLVAHWAQYSEYTKLSAIHVAIDTAAETCGGFLSISNAAPSYLTLAAFVPGGGAEVMGLFNQNTAWGHYDHPE